MNRYIRFFSTLFAFAVIGLLGAQPALAASGHLLDQDAEAALNALYSKHPGAKALGAKAARHPGVPEHHQGRLHHRRSGRRRHAV